MRNENYLEQFPNNVKESNDNFPDIRNREWSKLNCPAAKLLNYLIEVENILMSLDEYQVSRDQCYPDIEDMMLLSSDLTRKYLNFVDNNPEILEVEENQI